MLARHEPEPGGEVPTAPEARHGGSEGLDRHGGHRANAGHAAQARHLGKGVLERDIEKLFPDPSVEIIMYCGGGYRSALTCEVAQRMGYRNVRSLVGGYKAMVRAGWPMTQ